MCVHSRMRSSLGSVSRSVLLCAAVFAVSVGDARAEDHFWSSLGGGSFNYWLNWVPNFVPGEDDRAIFELDMDPAYQVTFYESVTNQECIFRTDRVIMDLGGVTYTLIHGETSLTVAEDYGQVAEVSLQNGTINATSAHVGLWDGASGTLDLESGLTLNASDHFIVGLDGNGLATIHNGASVNAEWATIGAHDNGNAGTLNVDGSGAELIVNETLRVGEEGFGILNLMNGAGAHSRNCYIGDSFTGYGEIHITDGAEFVFDEWLTTGAIRERPAHDHAGRPSSNSQTFPSAAKTERTARWIFSTPIRESTLPAHLRRRPGYGTMNVSLQATVTAESLLVGASENTAKAN